MTYCTLEEAWGSNPYNDDIPAPAPAIPPLPAKEDIENNEEPKKVKGLKEEPPNYFYNGFNKPKQEIQAFNEELSMTFEPDTATNVSEEDDLIKQFEYHKKRMDELYKRIIKKRKLKTEYKDVLEGFSNNSTSSVLYDAKDIVIMVLSGIFLIFILELFIRIGKHCN